MGAAVVIVFSPEQELLIQGSQAGQVEFSGQKLCTYGAEKAFDLSFGRSVAYGCVAEQCANAGADIADLKRGVVGAVVDVELLGDAAFVDGRLKGGDQISDVVCKEELAVTKQP